MAVQARLIWNKHVWRIRLTVLARRGVTREDSTKNRNRNSSPEAFICIASL